MSGATSQNIKILIVDDDKNIAEILVDIVSAKGRVVDVCHNGVDAVESIRNNLYDLIMVDLVMPKMGGLDVLKYAKTANPDVLVIIITGYASLETAVTAIKEGAYDYITKPCKLEEIRMVVENAIDKIRLNRENRELLEKLQEAYHELMALKESKGEDDKITKINFFSANMPNLHYLYNRSSPPGNYIDKLQALSSLRESGTLTESEFKAFKNYLLKTINTH
uniref:Sigma-54-dependent Fis family transcriptional regulator n=1 Tax=Candidatus Desulfatibia profunda TaxID=2841695 RepID=A0A8J6NIV0_9BACT|nr:sigma-54-dependent Fis family transcriptional regulator [Candidatus Desulfatibia profunda]